MKKVIPFLIALIIMCVFSGKTDAANPKFKDVPENHPNYNAIMYLLNEGVVPATERFGINDKVTREEVAIMIAKAKMLDGTKRKTKFNDVPASRFSSGYIQSAVNARIINGYPDGSFKPTQYVTRGHMAAFIANGFNLTQEADITFKDVKKGSTSYNAVRKLAASNITSGYPDGTFKPNQTLNKSHIAAFIARAMEPSFRPVRKDILTRNVYLGMNRKQVKESENVPLVHSTKDEIVDMLYYKLKNNEYGYDTNLLYFFEQDKLSMIIYEYLGSNSDFVSWPSLENRYYNKLKELIKKHGEPSFTVSRDYSLSATWERKGYDVFFHVFYEYGYPNGYPRVNLSYSVKN